MYCSTIRNKTTVKKYYFEVLKDNVKRVCIFHIILVNNSSSLITSVKNRGEWEGFNLTDIHYLLSVTKVIC